MASRRNALSASHPLVITLVLIAVVASMSLAADVIKPLALAVLLAFALAPAVRFLERSGLPRILAIVLTVVTALAAIGGVGYVVGEQLTRIGRHLPTYERHIRKRIESVRPQRETVIEKATKVASEVAATLEEPEENRGVVDVRIMSNSSLHEELARAVGPTLERLAVGVLVLVLVIFLLLEREDMRDRFVQLFGRGQVTITSRSLDELGQRLSRYLAVLAAYNSAYGAVVALGIWAIGLPYAVLWGFLAGALRFIPYLGPAAAFTLPVLFSIAYYPPSHWVETIELLGLLTVLEALSTFAIEPFVYGRTTGVSSFGLLVAAMFWTWLWGTLGLLLSTPLTVCLAVLGKYVPRLSFFATLLGESTELDPDLRLYQRLLARDRDGATELIDAALRTQPHIEVFDRIFIPALDRTGRDYAREELDDDDRHFILHTLTEILDDLESSDQVVPPQSIARTATDGQPAANGSEKQPPAGEEIALRPIKVVGVAACDASETLVLRMLALVLRESGLTLAILDDGSRPLGIAERITQLDAELLIISHLPATGLTPVRYLVRRIRAQLGSRLPLVVGRWVGTGGANVGTVEVLIEAGANQVINSLAEALDLIIQQAQPTVASQPLHMKVEEKVP